MSNPVCNLLDIKYPILQGAMSRISKADLVGAVSRSGGLGVLTSIGMSSEELKSEIAKVRALTTKPFGVNLILQDENIQNVVDIVIKENVPVVTTGAGNPERYMKDLKEAGVIVIPVIANTYHAQKMEKIGADMLIAEGSEAGGHIGSLNTFTLVPQVVESVSIPVIGAGGVFDSASVNAMLALGAKGVQAGTIFLASKEAAIGNNYKQKLIDASGVSTIVTGLKLGHPVRSLTNNYLKKYSELEFSGASNEELEKMIVGSNLRGVEDDDMVTGTALAGQVASRIKSIKTVDQIIQEIFIENDGGLEECF